jgi:hypothetical protein
VVQVKSIDSFLITYAALAFGSVIALSLIDVEMFDIYVALLVIFFFVSAELTPAIGSRNSRREVILEVVLLAVFGVIVIERLLAILT